MINPKFNIFENARSEITERQDAYNYILGGHGVVTLMSPTGVHYTYGIWEPKRDPFPDDVLFIYVKTVKGWKYAGMLNGDNFRITKASQFGYNTPEYKGITYMMNMIKYDQFWDNTNMKIYHEGVCSVCGRQLTSPKSIKYGIGPKCLKKITKVKDIILPL